MNLQIYGFEVRELHLEFNIDTVELNICGEQETTYFTDEFEQHYPKSVSELF